MATLAETFTGIANAIRTKGGTTAKLTPANMSTAIDNIKQTTTYNYKYTLTVTTNPSATITATKSGSTTKTATANTSGTATLTFTSSTDAGTWTIKATKDGLEKSTTHTVAFT